MSTTVFFRPFKYQNHANEALTGNSTLTPSPFGLFAEKPVSSSWPSELKLQDIKKDEFEDDDEDYYDDDDDDWNEDEYEEEEEEWLDDDDDEDEYDDDYYDDDDEVRMIKHIPNLRAETGFPVWRIFNRGKKEGSASVLA